MVVDELDLRHTSAGQQHREVLTRYAELPVNGSFVLVGSADPGSLRREFERDYPGSYRWEDLDAGSATSRAEITKLASTALPRLLGNADVIASEPPSNDSGGALWKLHTDPRHLDANIIRIPPGDRIETHTGPDLDVLLIVLDGAGELATEVDGLPLASGDLVWLPRRSQRSIVAGDTGLTYFTVHPRRPPLSIGSAPDAASYGAITMPRG